MRGILFLCPAFFGPSILIAATIHVPADQATIQLGIAAAALGDTVEIAPGIYFENGLSINGSLTVRGQTGFPPSVIIDGQSAGRILTFTSQSGLSNIHGIEFRNGCANLPYPGNQGGAIWAQAVGLSISDCVFRNNRADIINGSGSTGGAIQANQILQVSSCVFEGNVAYSGGALFVINPNFTVADCSFRLNSTLDEGSGGAIWIGVPYGTPTFLRCSFMDNEAAAGGALLIGGSVAPTFQDCIFLRNTAPGYGGAVVCEFSSEPHFVGCLFAKNSSSIGGAVGIGSCSPFFESCTFADNTADLGSAFYVSSATLHISRSIVAFNGPGDPSHCIAGTVFPVCTDVYGNAGGDWTGCLVQTQDATNFSADPFFCDPSGDDYTLQVGSPCAPPGQTGCGLIGALPEGCGPVSVDAATWGKIKSRYR